MGTAAKGRRKNIWQLHYAYPDGVEDFIGSLGLREDVWHIRYNREGIEIEEPSGTHDEKEAAALLLSRWREEQRKMDAEALLRARQRSSEISDPNTRRMLSHAMFDALVDAVTRASHRALDGAVAPLEWWEGTGTVYAPPAGFGCRCTLIHITAGRARRMIEAGEGFDLTLGLPAGVSPDPEWMRWAEKFNRAWDEAKGAGVPDAEAKSRALATANALLKDVKTELATVRWSR